MNQLMPGTPFKRMDQGKAYLARYIQLDFQQEKMTNHNRDVPYQQCQTRD